MPSADAIREIVCGYPQRLWGRKPLAMLQIYVDDSIGKADRRLFMAGYVLSAKEWIEFSDEWDAALNEPPAIEYLKTSEALGRWKQFDGWSEKKRNRKIFQMAEIIGRFAPRSFHTSINVADFDAIVKPFAPFPMNTPYFYAHYGIVLGLAHTNSVIGTKEPCRIIFDRQDGLATKVIPTFEGMMDTAPPEWRALITGIPQFEDDKQVSGLQAADLLVWHLRRSCEGNYPRDFLGLGNHLIAEGSGYFTEIPREALEKWAAAFRSMPNLQKVDKKVWRELAPYFASGMRPVE